MWPRVVPRHIWVTSRLPPDLGRTSYSLFGFHGGRDSVPTCRVRRTFVGVASVRPELPVSVVVEQLFGACWLRCAERERCESGLKSPVSDRVCVAVEWALSAFAQVCLGSVWGKRDQRECPTCVACAKTLGSIRGRSFCSVRQPNGVRCYCQELAVRWVGW